MDTDKMILLTKIETLLKKYRNEVMKAEEIVFILKVLAKLIDK
jgi:hypothetical protein